jgi:hypothetical protein
MRCQRCKFENIPGQNTCIKCGSALEIKSTAINVNPPRLSKWKKPFRKLTRFMREGRVMPGEEIQLRCPVWLKNVFGDSFLGLLLSIIPGLAHLLQGRFKEIRLYFFAWFILLLSGLFLYGSLAGFICLGLAIGIHAGIALQSGIIKDLENLREKIAIVIFVLIGLALIYRFVPRILTPNLYGGHSSLTIPYYKIEEGDYLLSWARSDRENLLARGSLVSFHPVTFYDYGGTSISEEEVIGQIVGLAGEQLEIQNGVFIVDGQQLDIDKYPVPQWLQKVNFSVKISNDSYFVSARYNVAAHGGVKLQTSHILQVCLVKASNIEANAFMRWWPLSRRGFIRTE